MNTYTFKTNIKCGGCIATVTPHLNQLDHTEWSVDLQDPNKVLQVKTDKSVSEIENAVKTAGFKIESL